MCDDERRALEPLGNTAVAGALFGFKWIKRTQSSYIGMLYEIPTLKEEKYEDQRNQNHEVCFE